MVPLENVPRITVQRIIFSITVTFWWQMSKSYINAVAEKTYGMHLKSDTITGKAALEIRSSHFQSWLWMKSWVCFLAVRNTFISGVFLLFWFPSLLVFSFWNDTTWTYYLFSVRSVKAWIHTVLQEFAAFYKCPWVMPTLNPQYDVNLLSLWNNNSKLFFLSFFTFYCLKTKMKSLPTLLLQTPQQLDFCKYYPVIITYLKKKK